MKLSTLNQEFGEDAKNKINKIGEQSINGALACLETFYYSLNNKDADTLKRVWYSNDLIQMNNPLGGITRGVEPIVGLYANLFNGGNKLWVKLTDIVYYAAEEMIVFTGTEIGEFITPAETIPLKIRTSRIFAYVDGEKRWFQLHHHGSIDNPDLLHKYQSAAKK